MSENHLFVLWPKARRAERRILEDLARETHVVYSAVLEFDCPAALAYRRFYGPNLPDGKRKVRNCGKGPFRLVVVRDDNPSYATIDTGGRMPVCCNTRMFRLKTKYREWAGRMHRVHGTVTREEFARDIMLLTGRPAQEWGNGAPKDPPAPRLPAGWEAQSSFAPFAPGRISPVFSQRRLPFLEKVFLRDKYINDVFCTGGFLGYDAIEKHSSKAVHSICNEYRMLAKMYSKAPEIVPAPLAAFYSMDGRSASVITQRIHGETLSAAIGRGLSGEEADRFAGDILLLARTLRETGIVHRDLFADNFIVSAADGRLKTIDWQLAIESKSYREDPWVKRNWKFRYVVFGVNRDLGPGNWNDFLALANILGKFPQTSKVRAAAAELANEAGGMTFSAPPSRAERLKLRLYALSLRFQILLKWRNRDKRERLKRRLATIVR